MSKDLFGEAEAILARNPSATAPVEYEGQGNTVADSLRKGWNSGLLGAGSQLQSVAGLAGEALGADEFASNRRTDSMALRRDAEAAAPQIGRWDQVNGVGDFAKYAAGLVGGSAPISIAGMGAAALTGGGVVPGILAAGAATAPFEMGDVIQKQEADPEAMQKSAGERLGAAALGGGVSALAQGVVPGIVGKQLKGLGATRAAGQSVKGVLAQNLAGDALLEGGAEGGGDVIKQLAANPNRDIDWDSVKENAIGGAVAGGAMGGVGATGDLVHRNGPMIGDALSSARTSINERLAKLRGAAGEKIDAAAETAPGKKIRGVFDDVTDMLDRGKQKFDDTLDKVMRGEELGSPADWLAATTDEAKKRMTDFSDSERVKAATSWAKEMLDDAGLDAAKRADITDALKNATDRTSQMTIAGLKKTWDLSRAGAAKIKDLADAVGEEYNNYNRRDVDVESRTVDEEPAAPSQLSRLGLSAKAEPAAPDAPAATTEPAKMTIKEFAAARKAFISKAMQDDPDLSPEAARELFNTSQNDGRISFPTTPTPPKLSEDYSGIHKVIADAIKDNGIVERRPDLFDTPAKINTMASTMRMLMDQMTKGPVKLSVMKKTVRLLGDDAVSVLSTLKDAMKYDADPQQAERFFSNINTMMDIEKGETALHEVMAASMIEQKTHPIAQDADVLLAHARGKLDNNAPRSPGEAAVTDRMINEFYTRTYGDKADIVRAAVEKAAAMEGRARSESKDRLDENGAAVEDTHHSEGGFDESGARLEAGARDMQVYGLTKPDTKGNSKSQLNGTAMHKDSKYAKQHMLDVRAKFPDVDSNGDYTHEVRFEQLPGSEYGHIVVEKYDNSKEFNETDLEAMKLDTHKYPDSKSRIEVAGHIIDAVKVASTMRGKLQGQFESGATTARGRLAEGFKHGLSMLMTQFGERVKVGDSAVIGYVGGMPFTWGEAQKLDRRTHADKMNDVDVQEMTQLRKEYRDAKNAGASPEVLEEILDAYKELEGNQRAAKDKELGRGEDYQGRSMKRQRPPATRFQDHMPPTNAGDAPVRGVYPAVSIEVDPETGAQRTTSSNNLNGESKDDDGVTAKDKDGNIHALGDKSKPVFGANDRNRVTRKPWGSVDKQDGPQIPAKVTSNAKDIRNKQLDLSTKDENIHRSNMDGSGHFVSPTQLKHNNLVAAIGDWDGEASAGAAKLKARAQTLLANFAMMSEADQRRFSSIAPEDVKAGRDLKPVKFTPMSMADARSIVNDLATKYKDQIVAPGEEAQSVPTKQVTTHQRNPVQFYNDGKAGVRGPEKAAGAAPAKAVTGVTLTGGQFVGKDNVKSKQATKFIGRGSANSSTASYARQWGDRANTGQYTAEDRVFISAEGKRTGRVDPDAAEIGKAMAAGATILTDSMTTGRERDHNVGERQVAEILSKGGYAESAPGVWGPSKNSAAKPSINEKLVDKVVLSENYPTTVAGAEKFLNAAKKRLAALEAEDRRVLNDDDHPTQRLPKEEQEVLDALRQTFDKNSDLAPFFTELAGWDAVPEAEQIRLMKFAESLTEGKPDPKTVAAKSAAFFGDKASTGRMQAEFPALVLRGPTLRERAEITKHHDALAARLGEKMPKVEGFSIRDGAMGDFAGKAVTRGGQHHILLAKELFDDTTPFLGSTQDKVERATLHEVGHLFDRDDGHFSDNAAAFKEGGRVYEELQALTEASAYAHDWYGYAFGTKNPHRELFAQAFSAFHYNPEALKNAAPKTYSFIRNYLQNRDAGGSGQVGRADNAAQLDRPVSAVQEADTTQAKKQAFLARAASGDKTQLEHLKTSTDAKGLQRALELLNEHEFASGVDGDNVMDVYDAIEGRLAELVGGSEDVAYGLQTRKYSLMSTSIHDDLGRGGFAAAHDSPIKHEGTFDWRSHIGKGEGNAAFGAGTYLSTADGVHRSYKDQFTAKLNRHIRDSAAMLELREQLQEARDDANHYLEILQDGIKFGVTVIKMGSYETREEAQAALDAEIDSTKAKLAEYRKMLLPENEGKYNADGVNRNIDYLQNEKLPRLRTEKITDYEAELKAAEAREDAIGRKLDEERAKLEVHKPPTYHVSVDIKKEQLLDWDKPAPNELLGDPTVRDALDAHYHVKGNHYSEDKVTGGDVYRALTMQLGYSKGIKGKAAQAAASEYLQSIGILGHQYNAAGGRNEMHPNYVIYDDSKITTNYVHFDKSATNPNKGAGPRRRLSIEQHIEKVLGKSVRVAWQAFTHAGQYTHAYGKGLIELSVHALNPMSTAYHESLHAFFAQLRDAGATDITHVLNKAASSEHVIAQLKERFKNEPAVLAQLKDPEERAAYMYQMWASDPTFKVSIAAKNVFQKIAAVIRKALGIWSNDERALHIMEYFHSGEYAANMGQPNAVRRALMETGTNRAVETAKTFTEPLGRLADAMVSSGDARLRDTNIPALIELADKIKRPGTEIGGDQGFIPAARIATTKRLGEMAAQLEGYTPEQLKEALEALQSGLAAPSAEGRLAVRAVKDILARTKAYMEGAGVELGDLGPDYFPRVWDPHFISQNEQAMQDMLEPYVRSGQFKGSPTEFIRRLTSRGGNEFGIESRKPGMQHTKARDLAFLKNEDVAPFLNKDLMGTLASYIGQAARRAEWERRLGGGKLETLLLGAQGEGATSAQMAMVEDYLEGVDGTLGDDINPTARRLMGNMIVYQNIRLLPMAMFSMLVDPMGILVRGGTVAEAWSTFKRGMASIPVTYGKKAAPDFAEQVAELVGVVDNAILTSVMGDLYTQGMVGGTVKKINNAFFKYNMVEGLNRAFRVGASEAAIKFMARHADGTQSTHSARWMAELGLRPGDIKVLAGGHIALTQAAGLTRAQEQRVHAAINQWVDGAMLRPDAADKPIWMNDPHYALISHLKQFVFTFQKVILGRMVHELRNGNYVPAMALATYVPVMIAADAAKGLIQGGGDVPEWKKGWGVADYVGHGVQRAGLFGVGQFGVDVAEDVKRGGSGFGALSGPTLEQLADAVQLMNGHKQFGSTLLDAMPANALYKESLGGHGEAKADPAVPH